jgi:flagellin
MARTWKGAQAAALALSLCTGSVLAQANIVVNGSFEAGLASWSESNFLLQGFDFGIDSAAHSGSNAFFGGAVESLGFLSQSLATIAGNTYDVDFWLASDGFLPNQLQVAINGQTVLSRDDILLQPYAAYHTTFVASSAVSQLQFGLRNDSGLLHLDDVSVAAVPEPEISLMMALGLGALAFARRRRSFKHGAAQSDRHRRHSQPAKLT